MKLLKRTLSLFVIVIVMVSFSQCSSAQKLQKKAPVQFGEVYCQNWVAGVKGGSSGINLFIPVENTLVDLDSVYFRGKVAKLEKKFNNNLLYIASFKTALNQPKDMVLSSDPKEEYGNQLPENPMRFPFELKDDECVISYKKDGKTLYYKLTNIIQRESLNYPVARPNKT
ncbi:hypothetical protein [uncultured Psychroserpens sp.]|uniref:hypothetical protein n=1 Tax=uncultured Psychroserpens sp. TaxID=255436 RepID=UPI002605D21A|nr:hypothetical protein [uncultured Psychroserpens sp.]